MGREQGEGRRARVHGGIKKGRGEEWGKGGREGRRLMGEGGRPRGMEKGKGGGNGEKEYW